MMEGRGLSPMGDRIVGGARKEGRTFPRSLAGFACPFCSGPEKEEARRCRGWWKRERCGGEAARPGHVPHRGAGAQAGPGGAEAEDARGRPLVGPHVPPLRGGAAHRSIYLKEAGQHMRTEKLPRWPAEKTKLDCGWFSVEETEN